MAEAVDLSTNYFELFGIETAFTVPTEKLAEAFRHLQHQVHPDKFANATAAERRLSVQQSSLINQAYHTLRNPLERGKYLLHLHGVELSGENATIRDPLFLMEQMELRESLAEIDQQADPIGSLLALGEQVDGMVRDLYRQLDSLFPAGAVSINQADLTQAQDRVKRLQFLSKLQSEISDKEQQLL